MAALETLAVVAYRQPVTRGRIVAIRGVNVDGVVRTLHARGLIEESKAALGVRRLAIFLRCLLLELSRRLRIHHISVWYCFVDILIRYR